MPGVVQDHIDEGGALRDEDANVLTLFVTPIEMRVDARDSVLKDFD